MKTKREKGKTRKMCNNDTFWHGQCNLIRLLTFWRRGLALSYLLSLVYRAHQGHPNICMALINGPICERHEHAVPHRCED